MDIAEKIEKYLKAQGITYTWLAHQIGFSLPKLSLALNGKRKLTLEDYARICGALGVDTNYFLKPISPSECENQTV